MDLTQYTKKTMKTNNVIIDEINPDKVKSVLQQGLREYNRNFLGQYERKNFAIYIQNEAAEIIAGVCGFVLAKHQTIRLEFVWVHEQYRKQGLGTKLFKHIEEFAVSKNCHSIQVSTMDFQGVEFYKKIGYKKIGTIPKWFCDKDEIFFLKELV